MARLNASFVRLILIIGIVILLILTYKNYNSAIETLKNAEENILKEEEESRNYKENEKVLTSSVMRGKRPPILKMPLNRLLFQEILIIFLAFD